MLNMTEKQKELADRHGTPPQFAEAAYKAVPDFISMDEARVAVEEYNGKWEVAGKENKCSRL